MSHRRTFLLACAALGATMLQAAPVLAQQTTPPAAAERRDPGPDRRGPPTVDERVARMTTDLGLTADQATKVRATLTAEQRGMDSALARRTAAHDVERSAMFATHTNTQKALAGILTPDQKLRHDAMRARHGGPGDMRHRGSASGHGERPSWLTTTVVMPCETRFGADRRIGSGSRNPPRGPDPSSACE